MHDFVELSNPVERLGAVEPRRVAKVWLVTVEMLVEVIVERSKLIVKLPFRFLERFTVVLLVHLQPLEGVISLADDV